VWAAVGSTSSGPHSLRTAVRPLSAAQQLYGSTFNPQITLDALSHFDDADLRQLSEDMKLRLATAAR
jgi:hypothetical protein